MSSIEEIKANKFEIIRRAFGLAIADIIKENLRPCSFEIIRRAFGLAIADIIKENLRPCSFEGYKILIPSDAIEDPVTVNDKFLHIKTIISKQITFGKSIKGEPLYTTIIKTKIISVPLVKALMSSFNENLARDKFSKSSVVIKDVEFMIKGLEMETPKDEIYLPKLETKKLPRGFIIA